MKRTHYDNLQVARTASPEVIKAAYRSLSAKYHPDRNPGDEKCAKVMPLINEAYAVLSNPARRKKHDEWIDAYSAGSTEFQADFDVAPTSKHAPPPPPAPMNSHWKARAGERVSDNVVEITPAMKIWVMAALVSVAAIVAYILHPVEDSSSAYQADVQWEFHGD